MEVKHLGQRRANQLVLRAGYTGKQSQLDLISIGAWGRDSASSQPRLRSYIDCLLRSSMSRAIYEKRRTALLIVDPYNDFMSKGGKLYAITKPTADSAGYYENMRKLIPPE